MWAIMGLGGKERFKMNEERINKAYRALAFGLVAVAVLWVLL